MKRMNCKILVLCALFLLVFAANPIHAQAAKAKLNKSKLTLVVGTSQQLKVKNNTKTVTWTTSKSKVASVSQDGFISAKKAGSTTITAKIGKKKLACKVTVKEKPELTKKTVICIGKKEQLTVTGTTKKITWKSSNKKIVKVNKKGIITGIKKGKATITATVGKKKLSCKVIVKSAIASTIENMTVGNTGIYGFAYYSDSISVRISNPEIATCMLFESNPAEEGFGQDIEILFYGHKNGTTDVTISNNCNTETVTFKLTVVKPEDTSARQRLIDFLLLNGTVEPDIGVKYISKAYEGNISTLEYDGMDNELRYLYEETTTFERVEWTLRPTEHGDSRYYITVNICPHGSDNDYFLTTVIDASTYAGETINFEEGWYGITADESLQPIANTITLNAFRNIESLLTESADISFFDLGFTHLK